MTKTQRERVHQIGASLVSLSYYTQETWWADRDMLVIRDVTCERLQELKEAFQILRKTLQYNSVQAIENLLQSEQDPERVRKIMQQVSALLAPSLTMFSKTLQRMV